MKRKKFIQNIGLLSGALAMGPIARLYGSGSPVGIALKQSENNDDFWRIVREQFIFPDDYIYLNTGGIGALPTLVINKVVGSMNEQEKFPRPGHDHDNWIEAKKICAPFFGPQCKAEELAFIGCATEGINIILNGIGLKKGDEIITSTHEHPALHVPLLNHHRINQVELKFFEPDRLSAAGNIEKISRLITAKTRMIFISHVTCTTGQVFPIREIGELAKQKGAILAVDGAQAIGNMEVNVKELNVDYYTCSGHKWLLGPKRTGILYVPSENLDSLKPTTVGAYSDAGYDISKLSLKLQDSAQRYEFGTQNSPLFLGLGAGARFIDTIGLKKVQAHNRELAEAFYDGLGKIKGV